MLGDRPIEITLQRAWDALTWRRRSDLAAELAAGALSVQGQSLDAAAIERLKEDDAVSLLFAQLSAAYPEVRARLWRGAAVGPGVLMLRHAFSASWLWAVASRRHMLAGCSCHSCAPPIFHCAPLFGSTQLVAPLVHERDLYLAWSLKRSKAVNGARAVVGVVGKGHLRGVCYALTHDAGG